MQFSCGISPIQNKKKIIPESSQKPPRIYEESSQNDNQLLISLLQEKDNKINQLYLEKEKQMIEM